MGFGFGFRFGLGGRRNALPYGSITTPSAGFSWTVGDVVTIAGTAFAPGERTIDTVVPKIGGTAISEITTIDNEAHTWTVEHTVLAGEEWAVASLTADLTDSESATGSTPPVVGIIYPVDGDSHTYVYSGDTGAFCVEDDAFVTMD